MKNRTPDTFGEVPGELLWNSFNNLWNRRYGYIIATALASAT